MVQTKALMLMILLVSSSCVPAHFEASATWGEHIKLDKRTKISPTKYEEKTPVIINDNELEDIEK